MPKKQKLRKGYQRFHNFLKGLSVGDIITRNKILKATQWKPSTLDTYLKKNKLNTFLTRRPNDKFEVLRNGNSITDADIAAALSQVTPDITRLYRGEHLKGGKGTYALKNSIGQGAVGHVWAANYDQQSTVVVIKHVNPRPDLLEPSMLKDVKRRFMREAKHGMQLQHEALVRYLDVGRHKNSPFLVMELAKRSLNQLLKSEGPHGPLLDSSHCCPHRWSFAISPPTGLHSPRRKARQHPRM